MTLIYNSIITLRKKIDLKHLFFLNLFDFKLLTRSFFPFIKNL